MHSPDKRDKSFFSLLSFFLSLLPFPSFLFLSLPYFSFHLSFVHWFFESFNFQGKKEVEKEEGKRENAHVLYMPKSFISLCLLTRALFSHLINSVFQSVGIYENAMISNK